MIINPEQLSDVRVPEQRMPQPSGRYLEQYTFFHRLAELTAGRAFAGKRLTGVFMDRISDKLGIVEAAIKEFNPKLTYGHIVPAEYVSGKVDRSLVPLGAAGARAINALRQQRYDQLHDLADTVVAPHISEQLIAEGLLDVPPFYHQGDSGNSDLGTRACMNACARMVMAGIRDDLPPDERALADAMQGIYGERVHDDESYLKLLEAPEFAHGTDSTVRIYSMMGIDLAPIAELAAKAKAKYPGAKCYCITSLFSETSRDFGIWHNTVLLAADRETVLMHDPNGRAPTAFRRIPKDVFAVRWTQTYDRAHLIVVLPNQQRSTPA